MDVNVTVVPVDRVIIVGGEALRFEFSAPDNLHALQWNGSTHSGHKEIKEGRGIEWLDERNYQAEVVPFINLWNTEKEAVLKRKAEQEAIYNSEESRFARLREARDHKLAATDYLLAADYPIDEENKAVVTEYRQALRDLPSQEGAPWDGGGEGTPWPELPTILKAK